jgi:hypothetical protein
VCQLVACAKFPTLISRHLKTRLPTRHCITIRALGASIQQFGTRRG